MYNSARDLLQEAELLAKSTDYNDIIDCSDTIIIVHGILDNIISFSTNALRARARLLEEKINLL